MAEVHDPMPVQLQPDQFEGWLSGQIGKEALQPAPWNFLQKVPVSKHVNSSRAPDDDATSKRSTQTISILFAWNTGVEEDDKRYNTHA